MAATLNLISLTDDLLVDERGGTPRMQSFVAAGLTGGASNAVPHGLPRAPRRAWFTAVGNATLGAPPSLDTSQGSADPTGLLPGGKLGYDATNVYIFAPTGVTAVMVHLEW